MLVVEPHVWIELIFIEMHNDQRTKALQNVGELKKKQLPTLRMNPSIASESANLTKERKKSNDRLCVIIFQHIELTCTHNHSDNWTEREKTAVLIEQQQLCVPVGCELEMACVVNEWHFQCWNAQTFRRTFGFLCCIGTSTAQNYFDPRNEH